MALAWSQWQSGQSTPILQHTQTLLPHLECRWIKSLREGLQSINAKIITDQKYIVSPERENDRYIMEEASALNIFSHHDLKIINYCRLFLNITTVSEMMDATGTKILPYMFKCQRPPWFNPTQNTTIQSRPSEHQVKFKWQRLCRQWCRDDLTVGDTYIMHGKWINPIKPYRNRRESYMECGKIPRFYHWTGQTYQRLAPTHIPNHYHAINTQEWIPNQQSIPIEIRLTETPQNRPHYQILPQSNFNIIPDGLPPPHLCTFDEYKASLSPWDQYMLSNTKFHSAGPFQFMQQVLDTHDQNGQILEVSDGSVSENRIGYGWIIMRTSDNLTLATGHGVGQGAPSSHRAEDIPHPRADIYTNLVSKRTQTDFYR